MKAVRFQEPKGFEGIDGLVYEDAPDPQPAIGDALVQVRAASFTPTELLWPLSTDRAGHDRGRRIPAHEGSGIVVALGYGAAGVSVGDEVYGLIDGYRDGWAADYVAIEVRSLAPKPTTVDFVEAAAIPQAALTSWQALFDHGHLESGQTVVIHGAGGGVGSMAVPLARWAGAHVIGTGRADARQRVLDLGADEFVDVEQDGWENDRRPGRPGLRHHRRRRARSFGARSSSPVARSSRSWVRRQPIEATSARWASFATRTVPNSARSLDSSTTGRCAPTSSAVYPLADAREAFMAKSTKHIPGKVVLTP